jgi:hypothetical protein
MLLAGCSHTTVVARGGTVSIAISEYRLRPSSVHLTSGVVTIYVHNYGRLTHNLVISLDGRATASTKPIWPGGSTSLTAYLSPGTYSMASTILSDQDLGAYGTVTVSP